MLDDRVFVFYSQFGQVSEPLSLFGYVLVNVFLVLWELFWHLAFSGELLEFLLLLDLLVGTVDDLCHIGYQLMVLLQMISRYLQSFIIDLECFIVSPQMLKLHSHIMISDSQHSQSLIVYLLLIRLFELSQSHLQELILEENYRQHGVLQGILMLVKLTQHSAEVKMSVGQCHGML